MKFEVGQRLLIWSDPRAVRVDALYGDLVAVHWPWGTVDPESKYAWDGTVAVPTDSSSLEWVQTPWRIGPRADLRVGGVCELLIPATECIVAEIERFDHPEDTGSLPRPTSALTLMFADLPPSLRKYVDE